MENREQKIDTARLILNNTKYLLCSLPKVDRHFWRSQGWSLNKMQVRIPTVTKQSQILSLRLGLSVNRITKGGKHSDWNDDTFLPGKFSGKVQEWLLKIIIALSWSLLQLQGYRFFFPLKVTCFFFYFKRVSFLFFGWRAEGKVFVWWIIGLV
jgi:hypothetical protein